MKKYLLILLAALAFVSCGNDDDDNGNDTPVTPTTVDVPDYSKYIDKTYTDVIKDLGTPTAVNSYEYYYSNVSDKVKTLVFSVNSDNKKICNINEYLKDNAFTADQLRSYFKSNYNYYYINEKDNSYVYGNTTKDSDATLAIFIFDNTSITYDNPKNLSTNKLGTISGTPVEVVNATLGKKATDLLKTYPNTFTITQDGIFAINYENDNYLSIVGLLVQDGVVAAVTIQYNDKLSDADIQKYYESEGYKCATSGLNQYGLPIYLFSHDDGTVVTYDGSESLILNGNKAKYDPEYKY